MGASSSSPPPMTTTCSRLLLLFLLFLLYSPSHSQQNYTKNAMLACYDNSSSITLGYSCNGAQRTCDSFLIFRSQTNYQSPYQISEFLNASAPNISALNSVRDNSRIPIHDPVLVPFRCSCASTPSGARYYQHDAYYTRRSEKETYLMIANDTFQGLTTCQAMIAQNPKYDSRNLTVGLRLKAPLRCACPTQNQLAAGYRYLLSYLIDWGDDVPTLADTFRTDEQAIWDANTLKKGDTIYPFTTLLIPLKEKPTRDLLASPRPPPASPPESPPAAPSKSKSSGAKWVGVGVGVGVGVLAIFSLIVFSLIRRHRRPQPYAAAEGKPKYGDSSSVEYGGVSSGLKPPFSSSSLLSDEARALVGSQLAAYKFEELQRATGSFAEEQRIDGSSVYRAVINGDVAAVKCMKGDVTNEISILKQMNHSNLVRLSGFCVHESNTYLVFEFADNGSLRDWIHRIPSIVKAGDPDQWLSWKQRVQIAYDVADGLNYLHNYTNPQCIHKDLSSGNVLLDGEFRAKLSNFGLARSVAEDGEEPLLTRHVRGTQGYMSPEYLEHGLISTKLDIFAFGVVMLELLSGEEPVVQSKDKVGGASLLSAAIGPVLEGEDAKEKLKQFVDHRLGEDYPLESAFAMAKLARRCVAQDPGARPTIAEVFAALSAIHSASMDWDPSSGSTPTNSTVRAR